MGKRKTHMTDADRTAIAVGINESRSLCDIAEGIGKSPSTVSREIRKHRKAKRKGCMGRPFNDCIHRSRCHVSAACGDRSCKRMACSGCPKACNPGCSGYRKEACRRLERPPYVCGACSDRV